MPFEQQSRFTNWKWPCNATPFSENKNHGGRGRAQTEELARTQVGHGVHTMGDKSQLYIVPWCSTADLHHLKGHWSEWQTLSNYRTRLDSRMCGPGFEFSQPISCFSKWEKWVWKCHFHCTILYRLWQDTGKSAKLNLADFARLLNLYNLCTNRQEVDISHEINISKAEGARKHTANQCDVTVIVGAAAANGAWCFLFCCRLQTNLRLKASTKQSYDGLHGLNCRTQRLIRFQHTHLVSV